MPGIKWLIEEMIQSLLGYYLGLFCDPWDSASVGEYRNNKSVVSTEITLLGVRVSRS